MADLTKLSDAELINAYKQVASNDLSKLSDAELVKLYKAAPAEESGVLDTLKTGAQKVMAGVSYPQQLVGAAITGKDFKKIATSPLDETRPVVQPEEIRAASPFLGGISKALFGEDRPEISELPSGERISGDIPKTLKDIQTTAITDPLSLLGFVPGKKGVAVPKGAVAPKVVPQSSVLVDDVVQNLKSTGGGVVKEIKNLVTGLKPAELSPKASKFIKTAQDIGIQLDEVPDPVLFGRNGDVARSFKTLSEMPEGEAARAAHQTFLGKVESGLKKIPDKISGGRLAGIDDTETLGSRLMSDFQEAQNSIRNQIDFDRKAVYQQLGPGKVPVPEKKLNGLLLELQKIKRKAARMSETAIDADVGGQMGRVAGTIENIEKQLATGNMQRFHEAIQDVGDIAFQQSRLTKEAKKTMSDLYFQMTDVYDASAKQYLGGDIAKRIEKGNALWKSWYESADDFKNTLASSKDPEKVYKAVIQQGGSRHVDDYLEFMKTYNPQGFDNARGAFAKSLIDSAKNQGGMGFDRLQSMFTDPDKIWRIRKYLTPQEIEEIKDIVALGQEAGGPINPSGTEVMRSVKEAFTKPFQRGGMEFRHKQITSKGRGLAKPQ